MDTKLPKIANILQKLAASRDLTEEEVRTALNVIGTEDEITDITHSDGLYFMALIFGLMVKRPTGDELLGFVRSLSDQSIRFNVEIDPSNMIDVSGTGGDRIKTFNIGTASSFVLAAGGVNVAKQATRSYTGFTGSADVFTQLLGLDPFRISSSEVTQCLERTGIVAFYTPAMSATFKNRIDFLSKLKNIELVFPTPWHLVSWVYSPFAMTARLYGIFDRSYSRSIAELFRSLGYKRVMVVHGLDGLDELSNLGETHVAELRDGNINEHTITPEEFGIPRASAAELQTLCDEDLDLLKNPASDDKARKDIRDRAIKANLHSFMRVLYGIDCGPKRDIVLLNAGAAFYLCNAVPNIKAGVERAREMIESHKTVAKLREVAAFAGGTGKLREWERELGVDRVSAS